MRIVLSTIKYLIVFILFIISLVFAFIEIRPLFAGDFLLMESAFIGFIKYLFRAMFFIFMSYNAFITFYCVLRNKRLNLNGIIFACVSIFVSLMTFMFYDWYVAFIVLATNLALLAIRLSIWK